MLPLSRPTRCQPQRDMPQMMSTSTETTTASTTSTLPRQVLQPGTVERIRNVVFDNSRTPAEYECCFGEAWPPRVNGWSIWDLKPGGAAYRLWNEKLFSYAKDLVSSIETDVEVDAAIHAWIVGKDVTRARPTVVIFSIFERFRKQARRILKTEMSKHNFGVMTLSTTISRDRGISVFVDKAGLIPPLVYGVRITISSKDGESVYATIGGEIHLRSRRYGVTVAHVFDAENESVEDSGEVTELEFDQYSDDDYDSCIESSSTILSHTLLSPFSQDTAEGRSMRTVKEDTKISNIEPNYRLLGFLEDPPKFHKAHDWALIDLAVNEVKSTGIEGPEKFIGNRETRKMATPTTLAKEMEDDSIWVVTGRDTWVGGRGISAIKLKSQDFVTVWAVRLFTATEPGNCGSWIVDSAQDKLFGVLRGSSRSLGLAYLTPGYQIIEDLEYMYPNCPICLPQEKDIQCLREEMSPQPETDCDLFPLSDTPQSQTASEKDYYTSQAATSKTYSRLPVLAYSDELFGSKMVARQFKDIRKPYKPSSDLETGAQNEKSRDSVNMKFESHKGSHSLVGLEVDIPPDYIENGRWYHGYRKGLYMYPSDEDEKDRMDILHKLFLIACRDQLHSAPFTPNDDGPRILDLGCGTGIWAIDMAEKYPNAEVQGMDISLIQPNTIPPNLSFRRQDIEAPWHDTSLESWDLIHMRMLAGSISSWPEIYQKVFMFLKPGCGWIEHIEIDFQPRCDDGSLPPNSALINWFQYIAQAHERTSKPLTCNTLTRQELEGQGFVDITEQIIQIPLNPWPENHHQKDIGRWFNLGLLRGLEAMNLAPLTRVFGWKKEDVDKLVAEVKRDISLQKHHVYCYMHIWTARRP